MKVALTGTTGFIGSHVLAELVAHGHEVTALVRGEEEAIAVAARGAEATVVDLYDRAAVVKCWRTWMDRSTRRVPATPRALTSTPPSQML